MKIVERVVQAQLIAYLEDNCLLSDCQHGYRKYRSTETALHVITDLALNAMDNGEISILVLLDISKCFDVVPHDKLLEKLSLSTASLPTGSVTIWPITRSRCRYGAQTEGCYFPIQYNKIQYNFIRSLHYMGFVVTTSYTCENTSG